MAGHSEYDIKEEVRRATDIVELVGRYVSLRREGANFTGLCPWHNDRRPSLKVSPQRQSYRCFVCGEGGDCFSFVMKIEGVSFPEALRMLAEAAGIDRPVGRSAVGQSADSPRKKLYDALRWAEQTYHQFLLEARDAQPARDYLSQRGITAQSIGRFRLGFAPNRWDWLRSQRLPDGVGREQLEQTGLLGVTREGGRVFDRFKGRLLFAIRDPQGRTVGFGGRLVPGVELSSNAKYVNSPETPLFVKSRLLYGLDLAREAIRRSETALIVEGYTDVIALHQQGIENAVAVLGTALGAEHIRLLKRFQANRVVLLLDGDEAGQRRASDLLELFLDQEVDLRIATLPDGLDPCDLVLGRGSEALQEVVDGAVDALEHRFRTASRNLDVSDTQAAFQAAEQVLATLSRVRASGNPAALRMRLDQMLFRLSRQTGISQQRLEQRLVELRQATSRGAPSGTVVARTKGGTPGESAPHLAAQPQAPSRMPACERELIELLLTEPEASLSLCEAVDPSEVEDADCRMIFEAACRLAAGGRTPSLDALLLEFDEPRLKRRLVEMDDHAQAKLGVVDADERAAAVVESFRRRRLRRQRTSTIEAIRQQAPAPQADAELLGRLVESVRRRQGTSAPTDG